MLSPVTDSDDKHFYMGPTRNYPHTAPVRRVRLSRHHQGQPPHPQREGSHLYWNNWNTLLIWNGNRGREIRGRGEGKKLQDGLFLSSMPVFTILERKRRKTPQLGGGGFVRGLLLRKKKWNIFITIYNPVSRFTWGRCLSATSVLPPTTAQATWPGTSGRLVVQGNILLIELQLPVVVFSLTLLLGPPFLASRSIYFYLLGSRGSNLRMWPGGVWAHGQL